MRLIDADALKKHYSWWNDGYKEIFDNIIDQQPTIEPERKKGKWTGKPLAGYSTVRCSICGEAFLENNGKWNYCPSCGAEMSMEEQS